MLTREEKKQIELKYLPFSARTEEQRKNKKQYRYRTVEKAEDYYIPKPFLLKNADCQDLDAILRFKKTAAPTMNFAQKNESPTIAELAREKEKLMYKVPISPRSLADRLNRKRPMSGTRDQERVM